MTDLEPVRPLDAHLGYWLRFVSNHVSHAFQRKVESLCVTVAEWVVLRTLYATDGQQPSDLAHQIGMTRGAISKLVDRLVTKRLARCTVGKTDRRYQTVTLTTAGKKLVPQLAKLADQNDYEFFGHLAPAQQAELIRLMRDIVGRCQLSELPVE